MPSLVSSFSFESSFSGSTLSRVMLLPHLSDEHGEHYLGAYTVGFTLWFCVCSMSGCALRLMITAAVLSSASVSTSLWLTVNQSIPYNVVGSFVFGLFDDAFRQRVKLERERERSREVRNKLSDDGSLPPLPHPKFTPDHTGDPSKSVQMYDLYCFFLKTAFCGATTSFSTMNGFAIQQFLPLPGQTFMPSVSSFFNAMFSIVATVVISTVALHIGNVVGSLLKHRGFFMLTSASLAIGPLVLAAVLVAVSGDGLTVTYIVSVLFAPLGAGLRYALSVLLNQRFKASPYKFVR
ncbi:hypothetical protein TeGR_g10350 [Tetraparma gracilis]|uniref:Uncharacterized protein n=1 Tax=Tetraparma gracilis TaxID=2962635 RepID=A0ABQ6M5A5_9STRA|nr:hypothetical protein TeGR_g10350 [Tetraparma gracilis]